MFFNPIVPFVPTEVALFVPKLQTEKQTGNVAVLTVGVQGPLYKDSSNKMKQC
jgi:hypothetical protein